MTEFRRCVYNNGLSDICFSSQKVSYKRYSTSFQFEQKLDFDFGLETQAIRIQQLNVFSSVKASRDVVVRCNIGRLSNYITSHVYANFVLEWKKVDFTMEYFRTI